MNDLEKRTCPFCAEIIEVRAKVCPRCRQWLTWKSLRHPAVFYLVNALPITIVWVMLGIFAFSKIESLQNPRPSYSEFPRSISILSSNLNWAQTSDGLRLYISGVVTNASPVSWKDVEFDCRFYDGHGSLLDASPGHSYMTLLPGDDGAFRVAIVPLAPTNQYASFSIRVANARNIHSWF